jgi:preprotein translocase subunit SecA
MKLLSKIFGSSNSRKLKKLGKSVAQINALEEGIKALSDADLAAKTPEFASRIEAGESVESLLPEGVCRSSRGECARARYAALRRAVYWRHGAQ